MTIKVSCPIQWVLFWSLKYLHRNHHEKKVSLYGTLTFMGPQIHRKYFLITNYKKNNSLNVFKCCFPSWICLCIAVIIESFDNWVTQNSISSNSMFYLQCKHSVKFTVILGDSQVILVTGFGKIRHIKVSCFVFDGRGVSGMCVFGIFGCFRVLSRDCLVHGAVPFIGKWRYHSLFRYAKAITPKKWEKLHFPDGC